MTRFVILLCAIATLPPAAWSQTPASAEQLLNVAGSIGPDGRPVQFLFTVWTASTVRVEVFAERDGSPMDPVVTLLDPGGTELHYNDNAVGRDARLDFPLIMPGSYPVMVADAQWRGGPEYTFRLVVSRLPPDTPLTLVPGEPALGVIPPDGAPLHYGFYATAGTSIRAEVFANREGSALDSVLALLDEAGDVLASNDDAEGWDSVVEHRLTADGNYRLRVADLEGGGGLDHFFRLELTTEAGPPPVLDTLTSGSAPTRGLIAADGASLRYSIAAVAGSPIRIQVTPPVGSSLAPAVTVHDSAGTQVGYVAAEGAAAQVEITPALDGTYTVTIADLHGRGGPGFTFDATVSGVGQAPPDDLPPDDLHPDDRPVDSGAVQLGPGGYVQQGQVLIFDGSLGLRTNVGPTGSPLPAGSPTYYLAEPNIAVDHSRGEEGGAFGVALATGDLDGDGRDELAVGAPGSDALGTQDAGMVYVFRGSDAMWPTNVSAPGSSHPTGPAVTFLAQPHIGPDRLRTEGQGHFGGALTIADFDSDGVSDLAVGAPNASLNGVAGAGAVTIFYGTAGTGLLDNLAAHGASHPDGSRHHILLQPVVSPGTHRGEPQAGFGFALAHGDLDADGIQDLVVGAPSASATGVTGAGLVYIFYGAAGGIPTNESPAGRPTPSTGRHTVLTQTPIGGTSSHRGEGQARFGTALAVGDLNGDGVDDLAIGAPHADPIGVDEAGIVTVFYGRAGGIPNNINVAGTPDPPPGTDVWLVQPWIGTDTHRSQPGGAFGAALAIGDLNGDGVGDLVVGAPGTGHMGIAGSGEVVIFYGSDAGLQSNTNPAGTPDPAHGRHDILAQPQVSGDGARRGEELGRFGAELAVGDVNRDGYDDLIVGAPGSGVRGISGAGQVVFFPGSRLGMPTNDSPAGVSGAVGGDSVLLTQPPMDSQRGEPDAHFGTAVATGDANGDGHDEVIAGLSGPTIAVAISPRDECHESIAITAPTNPYVTSAQHITVSGTYDGTAPVVTLVVNDSPRTVPVSAGAFSTEVPLIAGNNAIVASSECATSEPLAVNATIEHVSIWTELTWEVPGDVDLHLYLPNGEHCYWSDRTTPAGAELDVDNTSGFGPEHITMATPIPGPYELRVRYFRSGGSPAPWRVTLRLNNGAPQTFSGVLDDTGDEQTVTTFSF